jgi:excisionase family DNA binding protein
MATRAPLKIVSQEGSLTPDQAALILGVTRWAVYKLVKQGQLRVVRRGRGPKARMLILSSSLAELIIARSGMRLEPRGADG